MATCEIDAQNRLKNWSQSDMFSLPLDNPALLDDYPNSGLYDFVYNNGVITYSAEPEHYRISRISELKQSLSETDYYASQVIEDLFDAIGEVEPTDLFASLKILKAIVHWNISALSKYGNMVIKRKAWRKELQELED